MFEAELSELGDLSASSGATEEARAAIHARMRAEARKDQAGLIAWAHAIDPCTSDGATLLADVYEALSPDAAALETFFATEMDRLLAACEAHPASASAFTAIGALMFLEKPAPETLRGTVRRRLLAGLLSSSASVRRACVDLLGGHELGRDAAARSAVQACLQDGDWRVRLLAESSLSGEGLLPIGYTTGLADRVRRKMFNWTAYV